MKLDVRTSHTKVGEASLLPAILLGEQGGDRVFFLLQSEGGKEDAFREECVNILTHAILEGEGDGYTRLESALKELNGLLKGFFLSSGIQDVHAVVAVLEASGTLHLSHTGRAEAYMVRAGTTVQITEYYRGKPPTAFMHIVTGDLEPQDDCILSTQRLLRIFTPAQLTTVVHQYGLTSLTQIVSQLNDEQESASLLHLHVTGTKDVALPSSPSARRVAKTSSSARLMSTLQKQTSRLRPSLSLPSFSFGKNTHSLFSSLGSVREKCTQFVSDLYHPERKRRAHLFLLAGSVGVFVLLWMVVQLSLFSQRTQTREQLKQLVEQINSDISTAESRELAGDTDSANAILERAEERAKQVMGNESGLFRTEALDILDRIHSKREDMNRIIRLSAPRVMASLSGKDANVSARGFVGGGNGSFSVFSEKDLYTVSLNTVSDPKRVTKEESILHATDFTRTQSKVFLTNASSVLEVSNANSASPVIESFKTEDPAGWVIGSDMESYLRYLYILSPEKKQIYKYEHLSGRYGPASEYNVSGDLTGALDMTIAGPVYVLKDTSSVTGKAGDRDVVKLLRGEKQTFSIRNMPPQALLNTTKIVKGQNGNFYFLDPKGKRIIVTTNDGDIGDSLYLKQYVFDAEQVGTLQDLSVDPDGSRLYVLDEKKIYVIDLQEK